MVTELGIIAGLTDGSYAPKQNIDRASFARLVCVALNGGKESNPGQPEDQLHRYPGQLG